MRKARACCFQQHWWTFRAGLLFEPREHVRTQVDTLCSTPLALKLEYTALSHFVSTCSNGRFTSRKLSNLTTHLPAPQLAVKTFTSVFHDPTKM